MTLKRLMIILGILVVLAGIGIMWLWQYAYSPQGRARVVVAQLKNDRKSLRGWMLQHHLVREGFVEPDPDAYKFPPNFHGPDLCGDRRITLAAGEMAKIGHDILPIVIEMVRCEGDVRTKAMAIRACGKLRDPAAIDTLVECMKEWEN